MRTGLALAGEIGDGIALAKGGRPRGAAIPTGSLIGNMIRTCVRRPRSVARGQSANVDSARRDVKELTAIKQAIGENRREEAPRYTVGRQPPLERSRDGADFEMKIDIEPLVHHVYHFSRRLRAPEADAAWVRRELGLA